MKFTNISQKYSCPLIRPLPTKNINVCVTNTLPLRHYYRQQSLITMNPKRLTDTFLKMRTSLKSVALRITGNEPDSEDAIQDAFLRLWSRHESLQEDVRIEGYISRSVRNSSVDIIRQRTDLDQVDEYTLIPIEDPPDTQPDDRFRHVSEIMERNLSEIQRQIMHFRDIEQLEFSDISAKTGIPETTVRVYLCRARAKIREIYKKKYE